MWCNKKACFPLDNTWDIATYADDNKPYTSNVYILGSSYKQIIKLLQWPASEGYVSSTCRKAHQKLYALCGVERYIDLDKRRCLMKMFVVIIVYLLQYPFGNSVIALLVCMEELWGSYIEITKPLSRNC